MNWLVIVVLCAMVIITLIGYHRGLVKMVVGLLAFILAIIGTSILAPMVSETLEKQTELRSKIAEQIEEHFHETIGSKMEEISAEKQAKLIDELPLPENVKEALKNNNTLENYTKLGVSNFAEYVSAYVAKTALGAISYLIVFLALYIGLRILFVVFNIVALLPFIKGINKLAGGILGFVHAVIYVWVFFAIATACMNTGWGMEVMKLIGESKLLSLIYNYNFILMYILSMIA